MTTTSSTSSASTTSSQAAGGSVINVSSLVSQLVAATRAPKDSLIASQTQTVTTEISAVGTLKGALSAFQSALSSLDTPSTFNAQTASSSAPSIFTATAGSTAVGGTYSVTVSQLAQAQQLVSKPFVGDGSAVVGTGTLKVSLGGTSFNVTIGTANQTVAGIASAINSATGNPGVTATVITGTDGAHLVLVSIDQALQTVATSGAQLGAYQNRFQAAITGLTTNSTNLTAARSQIQDTDYAQATSALSKAQILQQAGTAMVAQANTSTQNILTLLQKLP